MNVIAGESRGTAYRFKLVDAEASWRLDAVGMSDKAYRCDIPWQGLDAF